MEAKLSQIPSVDRLLQHPRLKESTLNKKIITRVIQSTLQEVRENARSGEKISDVEELAEKISTRLLRISNQGLRSVINATGVFVHTNLGRAPLGEDVLSELKEELGGYCNLEYDLDHGERGSRTDALEELLHLVCDAPAALAVNNNAGATFLLLHELAREKEVIVSRGELVQIGGGFRVPDILKASGARLVEVGTTNMTSISDYEKALTPQTAMILKVHQSNFVIQGHTTQVSTRALSDLARTKNIVFAMDLGSGCLRDQPWDPHEVKVQDCLREDVPVLCFSGDKLVGGPQAGILVGEKKIIERLRKNPMYRALRLGKTEIFLLERCLKAYLNGERPLLWKMMETPVEEIRNRAEALQKKISKATRLTDGFSTVGGGAMPAGKIGSHWIWISHPDAEAFCKRLRSAGLVTGIENKEIRLDLRTVFPHEEGRLVKIILENW